MRKQEAGKGLKPGVGRQLDPILSRKIADRNGAFHLDLRRLWRRRRPQDIVLVVELSENLFQDILECDQPRNSAELVHHQGHMSMRLAEVAEQLRQRLRLRNDERLAKKPFDPE